MQINQFVISLSLLSTHVIRTHADCRTLSNLPSKPSCAPATHPPPEPTPCHSSMTRGPEEQPLSASEPMPCHSGSTLLEEQQPPSAAPQPTPGHSVEERAPRPSPSASVFDEYSTEFLSPPSKKRKRDDVSAVLLDSIAKINKKIESEPAAMDESDNFGRMVSCQHRMLTAEQKQVFMAKVAKAFHETLNEPELADMDSWR